MDTIISLFATVVNILFVGLFIIIFYFVVKIISVALEEYQDSSIRFFILCLSFVGVIVYFAIVYTVFYWLNEIVFKFTQEV